MRFIKIEVNTLDDAVTSSLQVEVQLCYNELEDKLEKKMIELQSSHGECTLFEIIFEINFINRPTFAKQFYDNDVDSLDSHNCKIT